MFTVAHHYTGKKKKQTYLQISMQTRRYRPLRLGFSTYYGVMCTPIEEMGVILDKPRPVSPYTVKERTVD